MKYKILSFCLFLTVVTLANAKTANDIREKSDKELSAHPLLLNSVKDIYDGLDQLVSSLKSFKDTKPGYGTIDNPDSWVKAKRKINSAYPCNNFILNGKEDPKEIRNLINSLKSSINN